MTDDRLTATMQSSLLKVAEAVMSSHLKRVINDNWRASLWLPELI
jgi:hypothetical protein